MFCVVLEEEIAAEIEADIEVGIKVEFCIVELEKCGEDKYEGDAAVDTGNCEELYI